MPLGNFGDPITLGLNTGTRCAVICDKTAVKKNLGLRAHTHPAVIQAEGGSNPTRYHLRGLSITESGEMFILNKFSAAVGGEILQSEQDAQGANIKERRVGAGHTFNWYLDSKPVLWDSASNDGGLFLCKKDAEPTGWDDPESAGLPHGKGSQMLGLARNDGAHYAVLFIGADGLLHADVDNVDHTVDVTPVGQQ